MNSKSEIYEEFNFKLRLHPELELNQEIIIKISDDIRLRLEKSNVEGSFKVKIPSNQATSLSPPSTAEDKMREVEAALALSLGVGVLREHFMSARWVISDVYGPFYIKVVHPVSSSDLNNVAEYFKKLNKITPEKREKILRAIKWWCRGATESDEVDRFLKYYITFEIIARLKYPHEGDWAKEFCDKYGLKYKYDGRTANWIRNKLMHELGKEKELAEELARKYASNFGSEVLKGLRGLVNELGVEKDA